MHPLFWADAWGGASMNSPKITDSRFRTVHRMNDDEIWRDVNTTLEEHTFRSKKGSNVLFTGWMIAKGNGQTNQWYLGKLWFGWQIGKDSIRVYPSVSATNSSRCLRIIDDIADTTYYIYIYYDDRCCVDQTWCWPIARWNYAFVRKTPTTDMSKTYPRETETFSG